MRTLLSTFALVAFTSAIPGVVWGQLITFESLPDSTPVTDGMLITTQYAAAFGVTFELLGVPAGTGPRIAKVGAPQTAFFGANTTSPCVPGDNSRRDMPAQGQNVGCFFLTDDGMSAGAAPTVRISYSSPVRQASGEILDVESGGNNEVWVITAHRADLSVITTITFQEGDPGTGDGVATPWSFDLAEDIHFIEIDYQGGGTPGLGFDNFSPASLPTGVEEYARRAGQAPSMILSSSNPTSGTVELQYSLPSSGRVHVAVYDVLGRLVGTIEHSDKPRGIHVMSWDGRDNAGVSVASGVYFVRLQFKGEMVSKKVVIAR